MTCIAVIGAGLSGLTLARKLGEAGWAVEVFEKSRGCGGRMATRRSFAWEFDHGAQFFTVRDPRFKQLLDVLVEAGKIAVWNPVVRSLDSGCEARWTEAHYIGVPRMTTLAKELARGLRLRLGCEVTSIRRSSAGWWVDGDGPFDWVALTCPAPQASRLAPPESSIADALGSARLSACFALMLGYARAPETDWDAASSTDPEALISWLAWGHRKPGRNLPPCLVALSGNAWAERHLEDPPEEVRRSLLAGLGVDVDGAEVVLHRWRYASVQTPAGSPYLVDPELKLAACGDWCLAPRVEAAFVSGFSLAEAMLGE